MNVPRLVTVTKQDAQAALDGFRAARADGIDASEAAAHEARLVDLVALLAAADAFDAFGRAMGRATSPKTIKRLAVAAMQAAAELPEQAA